MKKYFEKVTSPLPLCVFRIVFGGMLFLSIIRFWSKGWIYDLYIKPAYFFPFYGFEFVKPLGEYTYLLFILCGLSALMVAIGLFYRISMISLFLSFTYIELMDKTTYLNHYYFVSMICLLMIFLPAHVRLSVDAMRNIKIFRTTIPSWNIDTIKLFVGMLYFFAGLAKINSDWLLHAMPLKIWLPARNDMPVIGFLFNYEWTPFVFSWIGCIYDLSIPFLLWNSKTRRFAYIAVVVFHVLTALLFQIGMFPYIMIVTALIFFPEDFHRKIVGWFMKLMGKKPDAIPETAAPWQAKAPNYILIGFLGCFFFIQLILPFRHLVYPGELFWTEEGYRFSWRVMLMEKAGYAQFTVKDSKGKKIVVDNSEFLTPLQEKMMSSQPDMMLQYAHLLRDYYSKKGFENPEVYVDSYVSLNGRLGRPMVDPSTDLAKEEESFQHKPWIKNYNE